MTEHETILWFGKRGGKINRSGSTITLSVVPPIDHSKDTDKGLERKKLVAELREKEGVQHSDVPELRKKLDAMGPESNDREEKAPISTSFVLNGNIANGRIMGEFICPAVATLKKEWDKYPGAVQQNALFTNEHASTESQMKNDQMMASQAGAGTSPGGEMDKANAGSPGGVFDGKPTAGNVGQTEEDKKRVRDIEEELKKGGLTKEREAQLRNEAEQLGRLSKGQTEANSSANASGGASATVVPAAGSGSVSPTPHSGISSAGNEQPKPPTAVQPNSGGSNDPKVNTPPVQQPAKGPNVPGQQPSTTAPVTPPKPPAGK